MPTGAKNFIRELRVISQAVGRHGDAVWPIGTRETFARQRIPHRFIEQSGGMTAAHHEFADMEMVGMAPRKTPDGEFAFSRARITRFRHTRERLQ